MAEVQKHMIHVIHILNNKILNDTYSSHFCEIFAMNFTKQRRKSPGPKTLKNAMGYDVVNDKRFSKYGTCS